ncbi:hypothetical protein FHP29_17455 [Nocardioides albidus]|uniref:Uncharacterized protein n=1 Tax=Nocardioides albidus TaxID=1517589 RepID=A0A5C4VQ55_9ACTN|nr:hypothetical protein [Nocardioides albidus]TNM37585.1 hypothetical protein FHP29_17455 [Nocardioides albidus]
MSIPMTPARTVAALVGAALALGAGVTAVNEVLLHGFAPVCSDGHPEYDPAVCGVTWGPGLPYVAAALLGLVLLAVAAARPALTRWLLVAAGATAVLLAFFLLWTGTWAPVTPEHPEPAGPQLVLLTCGAGALATGVLLRSRPDHPRL